MPIFERRQDAARKAAKTQSFGVHHDYIISGADRERANIGHEL